MEKLHKSIQPIAEKNNWHHGGGGVFGLYQGYFFHLSMVGSSRMTVLTSVKEISSSVADFLNAEYVANADEWGLYQYVIDNHGPIFEVKSKIFKKGSVGVMEFLDLVVNSFQKANIPPDGCHACGSDSNVQSYYFSLDGMPARYCDRCYKVGYPSLPARRRPSIVEPRDYRAGFMAALFWTILASIAVAIAGAYIFDTKDLIRFSMVIPWAAYGAYMKVHGDRGIWARWIVIGVGMLGIVFGAYVYQGALFYQKGYSFIPILWKVFYDPEIADRIIRNILWTFLANLVNWIPIYWIMYKLSKLLPLEPAQPVNQADKKKKTEEPVKVELTARPL